MPILHRPLSSEGLRRYVICIHILHLLTQTSELGGVTTIPRVGGFCFNLTQTSELGGVTTYTLFQKTMLVGSLHRPLSSEGLRLMSLEYTVATALLTQTSELGGVTTLFLTVDDDNLTYTDL